MTIALRPKVEDSRIENSWDVLFVAVAVHLWTDMLADEECLLFFVYAYSYLPEMFDCWLAKSGSSLMMCPTLALCSG